MANKFQRSTDGSDSDDASTWALATATILGATGLISKMAAGDTGFASVQNTAESYAAAKTLTLPGTLANPGRLIAVDDTGDPSSPTTDAATKPQIKTTGASNLVIIGNGLIRGFEFTCGNGFNFATLAVGGSTSGAGIRLLLENCDLIHADTHTSSVFQFGSNAATTGDFVSLLNCGIKLSTSGNGIYCNGGRVRWNNCSFLAGTASPTTGLFLMGSASRDADLLVENTDFTQLSNTFIPYRNSGMTAAGKGLIRNSRFPSGWTPPSSIVATAITSPCYVAELRNVSYGANVIRLWSERYAGSIRDDAGAVKTGGAADESGTGYTFKMVSNANTTELNPLVLEEIYVPVSTGLGVAKSLTVDFVHDSATALTDADIWATVEYLGTSGSRLGSNVSGRRHPLATPANHAASSATFTGSVITGMTNQNKQKLVVNFTPQVAGLYVLRVMLGKASKTVYVDGAPVVA